MMVVIIMHLSVCFQLNTEGELGDIERNERVRTILFKLMLGKYQYTKFQYFAFEIIDLIESMLSNFALVKKVY